MYIMPKIRLTKAQQAKVRRARMRRGMRALRRRRISRIPLALKPHSFVERLSSDTLTVNSEASATGLFKTFNLAQISQVGNYAALFEYYTINKVVVEFRYKGIGNVSHSGAGGVQTQNEINPILYFKIDHNDITSDSLSTMKLSSKTREHQFTNNRPNFTIQLKPAVQAEAYKSSVATTYVPKWGQQLSMGDTGVPHYGLKCYAVGAILSQQPVIECTYKMYFTCKNNE